jgi:hypothetical protein
MLDSEIMDEEFGRLWDFHLAHLMNDFLSPQGDLEQWVNFYITTHYWNFRYTGTYWARLWVQLTSSLIHIGFPEFPLISSFCFYKKPSSFKAQSGAIVMESDEHGMEEYLLQNQSNVDFIHVNHPWSTTTNWSHNLFSIVDIENKRKEARWAQGESNS